MDECNDIAIIKLTNVKKMRIIKNVSKILIIILFFIITTFVAIKHEHWSDEAQSFLLARDNSLFELFHYMKYEGTPPLWVLVLKLFISLGGTYQALFVLPIIFSTIGLIIFEFRINVPWYIKLLFPFTYFILYQYSVVARSYCMVFPLLMLIASIYDKRFEKTILYAIILLFFMNISLHTLVIAGSLYLIFLIDIFKNKEFRSKRTVVAGILIFFELLITCIFTIPAQDSFIPNYGKNILHVISEATVGSNFNTIAEYIITVIVISIIVFTSKKRQVLDFFILIIPVTAILVFIAYQCWHVGVIWLLIFTYLIISNTINEKIVVKIFMVLVCLVQIYWTISSGIYDIKNHYSASNEVANFLKENNYIGKKIYGFGYNTTAIQPYFDHNIFENRNTNKAFHYWKLNNGYMTSLEALDNEADIYIVAKFYKNQYNILMAMLERKGYNKYEFDGYTYIKDDIYESEGYLVYIKGDVTNE